MLGTGRADTPTFQISKSAFARPLSLPWPSWPTSHFLVARSHFKEGDWVQKYGAHKQLASWMGW